MTGLFFHAQIIYRRTFRFWAIAAAALFTGGGVAPQPAASQENPPVAKVPAVAAKSEQFTADDDLNSRVMELVDGLRSDHFAVREESSEKLFKLGHLALPVLRSTRRLGDDTEQADRLEHIIASLSQQDIESKIKSFLRGGESELENWPELEKWFGDTPRVRELFVDLYREHPYLVKSLGGSPQQLSVGLSLVRRRLLDRGLGSPDAPQQIDLLALLLPMNDPNFAAEPQYDFVVVQLLQRYPFNEFRADQVFGKPFIRMVTQWMTDSDLGVREDVLRLTLLWKMDIGLPLALKTLEQNPRPIVLCRCMQVIARQGNAKHKLLLSRFLNDPTVVYRKRYVGGQGNDVQVGDLAAASIAFLSSVPVTKIGFSEPAEHDVFGIIFEELVVPMKEASAADQIDNDGEKEDEKRAERIDPRFIPGGFGQRTRSWEEIKRMQDETKRREAKRQEIHQNALKLVPQE